MVTATRQHKVPRFTADVGVDALRNWVRVARPTEVVEEHKAMLACSGKSPGYAKLASWLAAIAESFDIWLEAPQA